MQRDNRFVHLADGGGALRTHDFLVTQGAGQVLPRYPTAHNRAEMQS